jgi:hypothetical protein
LPPDVFGDPKVSQNGKLLAMNKAGIFVAECAFEIHNRRVEVTA